MRMGLGGGGEGHRQIGKKAGLGLRPSLEDFGQALALAGDQAFRIWAKGEGDRETREERRGKDERVWRRARGGSRGRKVIR